MDNVIDFENSKNQSYEESCEHEHECEHCQIRDEWVNTLLSVLQEVIEESPVENTSQNLYEVATDFYFYAFDEGRRSAYSDLIGYSQYNLDEIDGEIEE